MGDQIFKACFHLFCVVKHLQLKGPVGLGRQVGGDSVKIDLSRAGCMVVDQANHVMQVHPDHALRESFQPLLCG